MSFHLKRRTLFGLIPAATMAATGAQAAGRDRDVVRLTWGFSGLPLIAKERGDFAKALAKENLLTHFPQPMD